MASRARQNRGLFRGDCRGLAAGRQVLVLLPEIALTAQWLKRFEDRFGALPAPWHSGLTGLERRETWRAIAEGGWASWWVRARHCSCRFRSSA
jgi:hypothetical protein